MTTYSIYSGSLRHRRFLEKNHEFSYQVMMFYFNLHDVPLVFKKTRWISYEKFNLFSFKTKNYLLEQQVRDLLCEALGYQPAGNIYLLTNLSCLGYCINPISMYFVCKENRETLEAMVLQVTNTPWGEKKSYVLVNPTKLNDNIYSFRFDKALHVSPFLTMDYEYRINVKVTTENISIHLENFQKDVKHFDATLNLQLNQGNQIISWWYGLMTFKVVIGIYWQALKLWLKKVTFYSNPK